MLHPRVIREIEEMVAGEMNETRESENSNQTGEMSSFLFSVVEARVHLSFRKSRRQGTVFGNKRARCFNIYYELLNFCEIYI